MPQDVPPGWTQENNALSRTIARADFVEALALVVEIGKLAVAANHHPDIKLHHYRQVHLNLSTHSAGHTVTEKDFALAQQINDLSEESIRLTKDDLHRRFQA
jgi:4a-hydroxytetrahydrobiopterin dehydratase